MKSSLKSFLALMLCLAALFSLTACSDGRDTKAATEKQALWEECGFNVISMKNDFAAICGEDVVRTSR